jgi:hypothetical protein
LTSLVPPVRVGGARAREWGFAGVSSGDIGSHTPSMLVLADFAGGEGNI